MHRPVLGLDASVRMLGKLGFEQLLVLSQDVIDLALEGCYVVTDALGDLVFEGDAVLLKKLLGVDHLLLVKSMSHVFHYARSHLVEVAVEPEEASLIRDSHFLLSLLLLRCLLEDLRFLDFHAGKRLFLEQLLYLFIELGLFLLMVFEHLLQGEPLPLDVLLVHEFVFQLLDEVIPLL